MNERSHKQRKHVERERRPVLPDMVRHATTGGQPLDSATRAYMEPRFGHSFADVHVHHDAQAAEHAEALGARAYTIGSSIVFDAGQYAPETSEGQHLLAHELTHVVQQTGAPQRKPQGEERDPHVIDDLDRTIAALLTHEVHGLPPALAEQVQISFATPDDQFPPQSVTLPAVDLFLYDVRENLDLRSNEVYVERRSDGTATRARAPVRVDFSYLVTAWSSESVPDRAQDEHRLLGEVMRTLLRHRTIPGDVLQGVLADQDLPLPASALQPGRLQSMGEFWQALGGKPKAALNYSVTLAIDLTAAEDVRLVTDKVLKLQAMR